MKARRRQRGQRDLIGLGRVISLMNDSVCVLFDVAELEPEQLLQPGTCIVASTSDGSFVQHAGSLIDRTVTSLRFFDLGKVLLHLSAPLLLPAGTVARDVRLFATKRSCLKRLSATVLEEDGC